MRLQLYSTCGSWLGEGMFSISIKKKSPKRVEHPILCDNAHSSVWGVCGVVCGACVQDFSFELIIVLICLVTFWSFFCRQERCQLCFCHDHNYWEAQWWEVVYYKFLSIWLIALMYIAPSQSTLSEQGERSLQCGLRESLTEGVNIMISSSSLNWMLISLFKTRT